MKILWVHERMGALGGAEANIWLTAKELKRRGHAMALAHGLPAGSDAAAWRELFEACYALDPKRVNGSFCQALCEFQPNLIYVHKMADLKVLASIVASGLPSVRMVHDHDLYCMRSYKYHFLTRRICHRPVSLYCLFPCAAFLARNRRSRFFPVKWVGYRAKKQELRLNQRFHRLLVATYYMAGELAQNGIALEKIEVHPPVTHSGAAAVNSSFSPRNLILYTGQIIRGKGVDVLLESLAQITEPFECLIFGEGNHRRYCERLSRKLGLGERVRFKGFVPQHELLSYYREATVMVMSSVWPEPFGGAGLEALRYGLPVVAFDAGGIREWLTDGHNGFLVPWMDRTQFAARVQELLLDKTAARHLGENGRQMARQDHDLGKYLDGLEQTLGQVAAQARESAAASTP